MRIFQTRIRVDPDIIYHLTNRRKRTYVDVFDCVRQSDIGARNDVLERVKIAHDDADVIITHPVHISRIRHGITSQYPCTEDLTFLYQIDDRERRADV